MSDVLARCGGDEFGLVMPDCDLAEGESVAERIRGAVTGGETVSIGVACGAVDGRLEDLV